MNEDMKYSATLTRNHDRIVGLGSHQCHFLMFVVLFDLCECTILQRQLFRQRILGEYLAVKISTSDGQSAHSVVRLTRSTIQGGH